ncbi:hypothetical protein Aph01nite_76950 [Acrocarpospora phusangensis]|uniref:Uncharacterized protein n=1 Tax=Acrocarpospora phusangensis TaxID=1070424 RepID=A0A919QKZ1_9ACTN|nr:hypothetical protein [Acrocarpospora phusangensis]GIH29385.1 hypothetical protein Aph01nite_76950 [Acrocarpospora phusangensis]
MTFTFPEFCESTAIDASTSWTATFESYNQRLDDVYYVVTRREGTQPVTSFIVQVGLHWAGDDWRGPGFVQRLHRYIHEIAATGRTNTDYIGKMQG